MAKKKRNPVNKGIMNYMFENYEIKTAFDVQEALKDMFSSTLESMLEAELEDHFGYDKSANNKAETTNRRNGHSSKKIHNQLGESEIYVPRNREGSFAPYIVSKRQKDVSGMEEKVLAMYAKGQSQRDIQVPLRIGIDICHETVLKITDKVVPLIQAFRNRALKTCYPFVFVDAMYTPVKTDSGSDQKALYNVIGIEVDGRKDVLGFWLSEDESARH